MWSKDHEKSCTLCSYRCESVAHLMNSCRKFSDLYSRRHDRTVAHNGHGTIFFHGTLIYFHGTLIYFHGTLIYFHGTLLYSSRHTFIFLTAHFYISTAHFYTSHGTLIYFSRHIFISAHGTEHFLFCCYHSHVVSKLVGCSGGEMEDGRDETELITRYFKQGFEYREICALLSRRHGVNMSERTLRRRLALLGLTRRNRQYNMDVVRNTLVSLRDGPESSRGYRAMWHHLQMKGVHVPRTVVEKLMREIDPEGVAAYGSSFSPYLTSS